jgi:hypothetical protein
MSEASTHLAVRVGDKVACVTIVGRANFNCSAEFKSLLWELRRREVTRFILALSECVLMDSTFVGVLAKTALEFDREAGPNGRCTIELLGAGDRVKEMLDSLGVQHLFGSLPDAASVPGNLVPLDLKAGTTDRREMTRTSLEAHRTLMNLNPENRTKFADVEKLLAEDLQKSSSNPKT